MISGVAMVLFHHLFIISGVGMVYGQSDSSPPEDKLPPMVTCYNCVYAVVDGQVSGQSNCQEKFRKNAISQDECRGACYVSSYSNYNSNFRGISLPSIGIGSYEVRPQGCSNDTLHND